MRGIFQVYPTTKSLAAGSHSYSPFRMETTASRETEHGMIKSVPFTCKNESLPFKAKMSRSSDLRYSLVNKNLHQVLRPRLLGDIFAIQHD